jgi:uncharacterized membrane protein YkoI
MKLCKLMASAALAGALIVPVSAPSYADDPANGFFQIIEAFFNQNTEEEAARDRRDRAHRGERRGQQLIEADEAIEIARANGMVRITHVELDGRDWEVEGYDYRQRRIEMEIDARNGRIKNIDRRR